MNTIRKECKQCLKDRPIVAFDGEVGNESPVCLPCEIKNSGDAILEGCDKVLKILNDREKEQIKADREELARLKVENLRLVLELMKYNPLKS